LEGKPLTPLLAFVLATQLVAPPTRPALPGDGDPNDWGAYFDKGVELLPRYPNRADSLFEWAAHLDPTRAEPLVARWVAFWARDAERFERYFYDRGMDMTANDSAGMRAADSLYVEALERNPWVPQTLIVLRYAPVSIDLAENSVNMGWFAYARQQYALAASHWAQAIAQFPHRSWLHYGRALTFVPRQRYDSATVEMAALLAILRAREPTSSQPLYQSKEMVAYAMGMLQLLQGRSDSAQYFFDQALSENDLFFPARAELGDRALARRDTSEAARDFQRAAELAPNEAWIQYRYGVALLLTGRAVDALEPLERANHLEPFWAEPYRLLGLAWEDAGDREAATRWFTAYLPRAPRRDTEKIAEVRRRLERLRGPS
jgi:tetratricopeptide (TPR) repeat protein